MYKYYESTKKYQKTPKGVLNTIYRNQLTKQKRKGIKVNYAYEVLYSRTEQIIKSAILNKADNIVLGAWGCGAFGQNPFMISKVFKDVLRQYPAFDNVIFAIRCTAEYWKDNNYQVFVKTFEEEEE